MLIWACGKWRDVIEMHIVFWVDFDVIALCLSSIKWVYLFLRYYCSSESFVIIKLWTERNGKYTRLRPHTHTYIYIYIYIYILKLFAHALYRYMHLMLFIHTKQERWMYMFIWYRNYDDSIVLLLYNIVLLKSNYYCLG